MTEQICWMTNKTVGVNKHTQFSSVAQSCPTLCDPMECSTPGLSVHHQLLEFTKLMSIELVMPSNHLILCCPLLLLPSIFSSIRVCSNESILCIRWPMYWSFSFSISSVKFSLSVMYNSLRPHGLQHTRLPCPSPTPGVYSNSCPLSQWYHPTISFSVVPFSSYLQSFPGSGSFQMSQFFASGGQSIGVSASASVLPMNIPMNIFP